MPAKKRKNGDSISGICSMSAKQLKRKKPYNSDMMIPIEALTENQKKLFASIEEGKNVYTYGVAGTGKTFVILSYPGIFFKTPIILHVFFLF